MKQITINVYSLNELSDKARQSAYENWLENVADYHWHDENIKAIKAFCYAFNITLINYDFFDNYYKTDIDDCRFQNITKADAVERIKRNDTGCCLYEGLKQDFEQAMQENGGSIKKAIASALDKAFADCSADMQHSFSFEYFNEWANGFDIYFYQDGTLYEEYHPPHSMIF